MSKNVKNRIELNKILFISLLVLAFGFFSFHGVRISNAKELEKTVKYPSRPIKIIIPAGPGGGLDREIRPIAPFLEKNLGVATIIEYIAGATGVIAYNKLYQEKADGYTIFHCSLASAIALELTRESAKYVVKNLSPIAAWNVKNHVFAVHPDSWKTFSEFLNEARGRKISVAGTGGSADLQGRLMETALGIKFNWVPYGSSAEGSTAVAGKHVDALLTYTISISPMIRGGKLRALAVFSSERDPILPGGVPTFKELGHDEVPLFVVRGIFLAPPNTPKEIVTTLEKAIQKATIDPEFIKAAENSGVIVDFKPTSQLNKLIEGDYELLTKYKDLIK